MMAFKSDYEAKRTWDPDSGWELYNMTRGPPEYLKFLLRHPTEPSIEFVVKVIAVERIDGQGSRGQPLFKSTVEVKSVNARVGDRASEGQRHLIEEALYAYGVLHNGPSGPVDVRYSH